jgi:glycosyltransferase involved in cell wall biosynthesis
MRLSVIVPQYRETIEQIRPLLDSIYNQVGIERSDYEVIICNDGAPDYKPSQDKLIELYPGMNIRVLVNPVNGGCGPARQWGIDHSESDFIICADADDQFISCFALINLVEGIEGQAEGEPVRDIVYAPWTEEQNKKGYWLYIPHLNDMTWMHSKIFRREFLVRENIRFHPDYRVHEDGYFNTLAMACGNTVRIDTTPLYLWKWNTASTLPKNTGVNSPFLIFFMSNSSPAISKSSISSISLLCSSSPNKSLNTASSIAPVTDSSCVCP